MGGRVFFFCPGRKPQPARGQSSRPVPPAESIKVRPTMPSLDSARHSAGTAGSPGSGTRRPPLSRGGREEAERTRLRALAALHARPAHADAALAGADGFVDLSHRADRAPEPAVEDEPAGEADGRGDGDGRPEEEPPFAQRRRAQPREQPGEHRGHDEDGRLLREQPRRHLASGVGQHRIEGAPRAEVPASVPPAVPDGPGQPDRDVEREAPPQQRIAPSERQHGDEQRGFDAAFEGFGGFLHGARLLFPAAGGDGDQPSRGATLKPRPTNWATSRPVSSATSTTTTHDVRPSRR